MAGKPGRSGRPPNSVNLAVQTYVTKYRLWDVLARIAAGDIEEEWLDHEGEKHASPTRNSDRIAAVKLLLAYAFGQPTQHVEHTGEDGGPIEVIDAAKAEFQGRMDRLATRLGAAAMPEWPESG